MQFPEHPTRQAGEDIEVAHRRLLEMQSLVTDLLTRFLHSPSPELPRNIDDALARLGGFVGADRSYVFEFQPGELMSNTHEWVAPGIQPEIEGLQDVPREVIHYWLEPLAQGRAVHVPEVALLPDERAAEREILERQDIRSLLVVPMINAGEAVGFVGFDAVRSHRSFTPGEVNLLTLVADLICTALVRRETERQMSEAQARLKRQEERFRIIADTVSDVLWDYEIEEREVWISPDWPRKLGLNVEDSELGFSDWLEHVHPADRQRAWDTLNEAIRSGAERWECDYRAVGSDDAVIDVEARGSILRRADGWAVRMLGNLRNVTAEKRRREGASRSRALEAVGQLTGGIAHDFNNLLAVIQGNAELLTLSDLAQEDAECVSLIARAAHSSAQLTARLLSFSGQIHLNLARVDLAEVLRELAPLLRSGLTEAVDLAIEIEPGRYHVEVDQAALEQAIINLAVNSRDAMVSGGTVRITCAQCRLPSATVQDIGEVREGDYACIRVIDTGKGMAKEVLSRALEPFFTTKQVGQGTGLGLSMVYGFARQSQGALTIESEPGQGTTATLYLPMSDLPLPARPSAAIARSAQPASGRRVLVVEDQPDIRRHAAKMLARAGFEVASAPDAASALDLLEREGPFDVLFTDVLMPGGMNGVQLSNAAAHIVPDMKVLYTSGFPADAFDQIGLDNASELNLLKKPYRTTELIAAIGRLIEDEGGD
ncbi:MAG: ATP-binding protein [Erythrobacter sp.]|nr:ATP-binding protein [Erythrobacter sp.]